MIRILELALLITFAIPNARVIFDHNPNSTANREFKFKHIASPVKDDAAANAKLTLIDGDLDQGGAELSALIDGRVPVDEDEPGANIFFRAGSSGGRFRMDFTTPIEIIQVNTYSGTQTRVAHSCTSSTPQTDLIRSSIPTRSVESIRRVVAGISLRW